MPRITVRRDHAGKSNYIPTGCWVLRTFAMLDGNEEGQVREAVQKAAEGLAEELRAEGFKEVEVRKAEVSGGWGRIKYEATLVVHCEGPDEEERKAFPGLWVSWSLAEMAKMDAAVRVSKRKADKGKGRGIVVIEV